MGSIKEEVMKKYIALTFYILGSTLYAREFSIVNKTGGTIDGTAIIAQTIHFKPLAQKEYTVSQGEASWRSGTVSSEQFSPKQLTLPPSIFTLQNGDSLKVSLPDLAVLEKDRYGYTVYDFEQSPSYDIKTSKVIGHKNITVQSGPIFAGKGRAVRQINVPIYASTRIVPHNGVSYTLSIEGNNVIVLEATLL